MWSNTYPNGYYKEVLVISDNALGSCLSGTKYWILAIDSVRYNASEMGGDAYWCDNGIAKMAKEFDFSTPPDEFDELGSSIRHCLHARRSPFKSDMLCNVRSY